MKIEQIISDAAVKAVKALYGIEAAPGTTVPQKTKKEFEGNLTLVVFPFLKASHKAPEATAQEIGEYLLANEPAVASLCNLGLSQFGDRSFVLEPDVASHRRGGRFRDA